MWHVGAFGSCRIFTPLILATKAGRLLFKRDGSLGYLHNPLEIIQAIKFLRGTAVVSKDLADLASVSPHNLGFEDRFFRLFENAEAMIVEISSIRIIEYKGTQLQINRVRELLTKVGVEEKAFNLLFKPSAAVETLRADLAAQIKGRGSKLARDLIKNGNFYELDNRRLIAALLELRGLIDRPVLFVGFFTQNFDGADIPQRVLIRNALDKVAGASRQTGFFDPTRFILADGPEVALLDLGHYNKAYEPVVAEKLAAIIDQFCSGSTEAQSLLKRRQVRDAARKARESEPVA